MEETLTPPGHLVSSLVYRGPWMSTLVLCCWCHSDSASVLLYFTFQLGYNKVSFKTTINNRKHVYSMLSSPLIVFIPLLMIFQDSFRKCVFAGWRNYWRLICNIHFNSSLRIQTIFPSLCLLLGIKLKCWFKQYLLNRVYYTIPFGFSFFRHFWDIIFQPFQLPSLAKDHWRGFNTRNAHMVHIVNYFRFKMVYTSQ